MVLVLLCVIIAGINRNFLSFGNFVRMSQDAAIPLVLGIGETFIILMGSIDLAVEGVLTLGAVILSMTVLNGMFGAIDVDGKHFDFKMPQFDQLDDATLAAVLNFVVFDLGNAQIA